MADEKLGEVGGVDDSSPGRALLNAIQRDLSPSGLERAESLPLTTSKIGLLK